MVVHDTGLVTEWAMRDCVGDTVTITEPKSSFAPPAEAAWLLLVGDLTAMPAIARILEPRPRPADVRPGRGARRPRRLPPGPRRRHLAGAPRARAERDRRGGRGHRVARGEGYFWMAGESAQMRGIRKHLMREIGLPTSHYDVMGYWRGDRRPAAARGRSGTHLARRQGGREE